LGKGCSYEINQYGIDTVQQIVVLLIYSAM
jgi:hypothetical protein